MAAKKGINIRIVNEKIWREFSALSTEMVLTKNGRCGFPVFFAVKANDFGSR